MKSTPSAVTMSNYGLIRFLVGEFVYSFDFYNVRFVFVTLRWLSSFLIRFSFGEMCALILCLVGF